MIYILNLWNNLMGVCQQKFNWEYYNISIICPHLPYSELHSCIKFLQKE